MSTGKINISSSKSEFARTVTFENVKSNKLDIELIDAPQDWGSCHGGGAAYYDGELHLFSGDETNKHRVYNLSTGQFYEKADCPFSASLFAYITVGDKFYVFGGRGMDENKECYEYSFKTDTWVKIEDMPDGRYHTSAAVGGDVIYIIGGFDTQGYQMSSNYGYNVKTGTWYPYSLRPEPGAAMISTTIDGKIFSNDGASPYILIFDYIENTWGEMIFFPISGPPYTMKTIGDSIAMISGEHFYKGYLNGSGSFFPSNNIITSREQAVTTDGRYIYALGASYSEFDMYIRKIEACDVKSYPIEAGSVFKFDKDVVFEGSVVKSDTEFTADKPGIIWFTNTDVSGYVKEVISGQIKI